MADPSLTVSLEPYLVDRLRSLLSVLPNDHGLKGRLSVVNDDPLPSSVPYSLLSDLSKWTRTSSGVVTLENASLDTPHNYSMIALLTGTRAAPEKHFPTPVGGWPTPAQLRAQDAHRDVSDRQALAHVVNALISIGGAAIAVWYAAGVAGWKNEWRVLLGFLAAIIVAIAEAGIYIIYTSYTTSPERVRRQHRIADKNAAEADKREEEDDEPTTDMDSISTAVMELDTLRQRHGVPA